MAIQNVLDNYTISSLNKLICSHITQKTTLTFADTDNAHILISTNTINNILNKYTMSYQTTCNGIIVLFENKQANIYTKYGTNIDISCKGLYTSLEYIETDIYIVLSKGTMHFAYQSNLLRLPKNIDIKKVYNMSKMFLNAKLFNCDLNWDVKHVIDMSEMFYGATSFNGNISNWNVCNVKNMFRMFYEAKNFNGNISKWRVDNVKQMEYMFYYARSFNCMYPYGNLNSWNTKKAKKTNMFLFAQLQISECINKWTDNLSTIGIDTVDMPGYAVV